MANFDFESGPVLLDVCESLGTRDYHHTDINGSIVGIANWKHDVLIQVSSALV